MSNRDVRECRAVLERSSRSFALAARFLPPAARDHAAVLYAFCRRIDDAIDEAPAAERPAALARIRAEVAQVYREASLDDVVLRATQVLIRERRIPRVYVDELVAGMEMDVRLDAGELRYETEDDLLRYCHRVAGVVGLMCCHVLGVRDDRAVVPAARLGWAMQLTNICRDVAEDWSMGRLYLPVEWFERAGVSLPGQSISHEVRRVVAQALDRADVLYADARRGLRDLDMRSALAIDVAAQVYREIGAVIRERDHDVLAGRAFVSSPRKARVVARVLRGFAPSLPQRALRAGSFGIPARVYQLADLLNEDRRG